MNKIFDLHHKNVWILAKIIVELYNRGYTKNNENHPIYDLKDSILHRTDSLVFHLDIVNNRKGIILEILKYLQTNTQRCLHDLDSYKSQLLYFFDDIVFNCSSLFDYIGNLVGLVYLGVDKLKINWNGAVKSSHDKNNRLSKSMIISSYLIEQNKYIVDALYKYRSVNIHFKTLLYPIKNIIVLDNIENNPYNNHFVNLPKSISKIIKPINTEISENERNVFTISYWLVNKSLEIYNNILKIIAAELHIIIPDKLK